VLTPDPAAVWAIAAPDWLSMSVAKTEAAALPAIDPWLMERTGVHFRLLM